MKRPDAKVGKVYLHPKPVDFRKSIDGLALGSSVNPAWHRNPAPNAGPLDYPVR